MKPYNRYLAFDERGFFENLRRGDLVRGGEPLIEAASGGFFGVASHCRLRVDLRVVDSHRLDGGKRRLFVIGKQRNGALCYRDASGAWHCASYQNLYGYLPRLRRDGNGRRCGIGGEDYDFGFVYSFDGRTYRVCHGNFANGIEDGKGMIKKQAGARKGRYWGAVIAALLCLALGMAPVSAQGTEAYGEMPEDYGAILEELPEDVRDRLPEGIESEDAETVGEAVQAMTDGTYLLDVLTDLAGVELGQAARLFAKLLGLLLLAALLSRVCGSLGSDALSGTMRFCSTTAIFSAIIYVQFEHLQHVQTFFERLSSLMEAMIPVAGAVWAMGGNVSTASAGTSGLYVFLAVCERLCAETVMPICCFCTALALCNTLSPDMGLKGLSGSVKKIYTFSLGLIMTLLVASLGSQTTLTAAADSMTARTAKMVSSTVIPTVGGSVGETLRTVGAGVQYLKGVVGIGGIAFLLLLTLPVLLSLLMTRLAFLLCGGIAELLGCDSESRLLGELGNIYGCMIAVVAMTSVMFILALVIFVKTVVAAM